MSSLSSLKSFVEAKLPQAFTLRKLVPFEVTGTGIAELDELIRGLPRGGLTEIYGAASSGRTSLAISFLAEMTKDNICAIVDASDSLDPDSLAAAGVHLDRILWIRCSEVVSSQKVFDSEEARTDFKVARTSRSAGQKPGWLSAGHPRNEARGLSGAISTLMSQEPPGTPSFKGREESESLVYRPLPWGEGARRAGEGTVTYGAGTSEHTHSLPCKTKVERPVLNNSKSRHSNSWTRLEQALKVTDLLLHNGGFGAVVMDLGDIPSEKARRIPLASWFRFRSAIENTSTALVLVTCEPCTQNCASLALHCERCQELWTATSNGNAASRVLTLEGLKLQATITRAKARFQVSGARCQFRTRLPETFSP